MQKNVYGSPLHVCCRSPMTGFYRNGLCETDAEDFGSHTICCLMTDEFLSFSKERGNDLSTPREEFGFAGLKSGDRWCVCIERWVEAYRANKAPLVILAASHESILNYVSLPELEKFSANTPPRQESGKENDQPMV